MAEYFLAKSLVAFRNSINAEFPRRDKNSDGWIGDAAHAARPSEHNPCWTCTGSQYGIVRAIDVDIDDNDTGRDLRREILNSAIGHPAVWYVISNGIIYSRTFGWKARKYEGANGHFKHVHVSINKNSASANDVSLKLKTRSLPPTGSLPQAPVSSKDPLGKGDATLSLFCIDRIQRAQPVSGECFGDGRRIMAVARILQPEGRSLEIGWYSARHSEELARARGDMAAVGSHLRHQKKLFNDAVKLVQQTGGLEKDSIVGPKTQAYMGTFGYRFKKS